MFKKRHEKVLIEREKKVSIKKKPRHVGLGLLLFFLFKGEDNMFKIIII
jgi:hypothetical protein